MSTENENFDYVQGLKILTPSEIRVLDLVAIGLTNKEIATKLNLSDFTVKVHRYNICKKLNLIGPNALIKWLYSVK